MKKPNRIIRLIKLVFRANTKRSKQRSRHIKLIFPTNWSSRWALPILVFLLSSFFMYGDLGNNETKIALGLLKNNTKNWNYLTQEGQLYRFLTYSVIHQDTKHYLGNMVNMLGLWAISMGERHKRIEITYITAVVLAGLAHLHFTPSTYSITMGASAGVMGLAGLYTYKRIEKNDWWSALLFLAFCATGDITQISQKVNVAWIAHWSGLLVGVAFGTINVRIASKEVNKP